MHIAPCAWDTCLHLNGYGRPNMAGRAGSPNCSVHLTAVSFMEMFPIINF